MARPRIADGDYGSPGVSPGKNAKGKYRAWITVREWNGRNRMLTSYASTKGKAMHQVLSRAEEWKSGNNCLGKDATVAELLQSWLNSRIISDTKTKGEVAPQTLSSYAYYAHKYVVPEIGKLRVKDLRAGQAKRFLNGLISDGRGHSRAKTCKTILKQAFDYAMEEQMVHANPITSARLGTSKRISPRALTNAELLILRDAVRSWRSGPGLSGPTKSEHLEDMFEIMLGTGLRIGEVLALQWEDVDLAAGTLTVHATLVEERGLRDGRVIHKGKFYYQDHRKSGAEDIQLELPEWVISILVKRRLNDPMLNPIGAVFVSRNGTWMRMSNMRSKFREAKKAAGIDLDFNWMKPHTLRKTALTLVHDTIGHGAASIHAGRDAAAKQAGHSDHSSLPHYIDQSRSVVRNGAILQKLAPASA